MSTLKTNIVVAPQEVYAYSATQGTDLGALVTTGDGRYFRYAKANTTTALVPGQMQQGPTSDVTNISPVGGLAIGQANATGSFGPFTISTSTTLSANQLAGAIMSVAVTPGQGYSYRVKSNSATSSATGCSIVLEDPLQTNLSTSSRVVFAVNPYNGVQVVGTAPVSSIVGVPMVAIPTGNFGWLQVAGPASVLIGGTPGSGQAVGLNLANTTGAVSPATGVWFTSLGNMTATGASAEYDVVNLQIS